ncbi:MAG TPA: hypothetical protein VGM86_20410 [Thermoanaerobaculia bacterium]|jgi:hypothetical protein
MRDHTRFRLSPEDRSLLWSGVIQLGSAAALADLQFHGADLEIIGFGPPWFDHIVSFVVLMILMWGAVICLTILVHAFISVGVFRQSPQETLASFKFVVTAAFILILVCSYAHHRHSAKPTSDRYEDVD